MKQLTQSREKEDGELGTISVKQVKEVLDHWDVCLKDLNYAVNDDPNDIPYLVLDHEAYFGVEAHLFTVADIALWIPELLPSGDVVVYFPVRPLITDSGSTLSERRMKSWDALMHIFDYIMHQVHQGRAKHGDPSESWAHCEREEDGYFEILENQATPIDKILRLVDPSITEAILTLNRHGFTTIESCSGLKKDHDGASPFGAYVCFDDEYYHDVSAHLFTLADASGWDPTFGAHGFDVLFHCTGEGESEILDAWNRLETVAKELGEWLVEYRSLVEPDEEYYYYRFRKERSLFSKYYSEEDRSLSGLIEELERIDEEFYGDDEE